MATRQQLLDAIDNVILGITKDTTGTASYDVMGRRWSSHNLKDLIDIREKLAGKVEAESSSNFYLAELGDF
jgi:hypothetical protein